MWRRRVLTLHCLELGGKDDRGRFGGGQRETDKAGSKEWDFRNEKGIRKTRK